MSVRAAACAGRGQRHGPRLICVRSLVVGDAGPPPAPSLLGRVPSVVVTVVASLHVADPVGPYRGVMEQGRALRGGVPRGKPFEGLNLG